MGRRKEHKVRGKKQYGMQAGCTFEAAWSHFLQLGKEQGFNLEFIVSVGLCFFIFLFLLLFCKLCLVCV
jgi:hypothetical protein